MVAQAYGAADMVPLDGGTMTGTLTLEGTPPLAVPAGGASGKVLSSDADGNASWQDASSAALGGVTVTGTPAQGQALVAASGTGATWQGVSGARPEWFGTIGAGSDDIAINAAITAVYNGQVPGPVCLTQPYTTAATVTALPGVNIVGTGQGNRQVGPPDTFTGGSISPSISFTANTPLITIGVTSTGSQYQTNPNGITLFGVNLSGYCAQTSTYIGGTTGVLVTDTADVHLTGCFLAGFDRGGATGTCVSLSSATSGNGVGLELQNCILSDSWRGLYTTGAGATDMRIKANLLHSNTEGITLGAGNLGGGGAQLSGNHYVYTGAPSTGWHLFMGSQAGSSVITGDYFDQAGTATVPVQLVTAKIVLSDCVWLANGSSTATSLVKLETASQEMVFCGHSCNANGSSLVSLLQTSAHSGTPTGGVWANNVAFGTTGSFVGVLIDSSSAAITATTTSAVSVSGNVVST